MSGQESGEFGATQMAAEVRQAMLVHLRDRPMTQNELALAVVEDTSYSVEECTEHIPGWLVQLRSEGLVWAGELRDAEGAEMMAAALTRKGMEEADRIIHGHGESNN